MQGSALLLHKVNVNDIFCLLEAAHAVYMWRILACQPKERDLKSPVTANTDTHTHLVPCTHKGNNRAFSKRHMENTHRSQEDIGGATSVSSAGDEVINSMYDYAFNQDYIRIGNMETY